jgi:hypothetical protein
MAGGLARFPPAGDAHADRPPRRSRPLVRGGRLGDGGACRHRALSPLARPRHTARGDCRRTRSGARRSVSLASRRCTATRCGNLPVAHYPGSGRRQSLRSAIGLSHGRGELRRLDVAALRPERSHPFAPGSLSVLHVVCRGEDRVLRRRRHRLTEHGVRAGPKPAGTTVRQGSTMRASRVDCRGASADLGRPAQTSPAIKATSCWLTRSDSRKPLHAA